MNTGFVAEAGRRTHRVGRRFRWSATLLLGQAFHLAGSATEPPVAPPPRITTNHVLVTNALVVTVTNYVVVTNTVFVTNDSPALPTHHSITPSLHYSTTPSPQSANTPTAALPPLDWLPPPDTFDWIQLKSGEWLKGRLKAMQGRKLEFDSRELDALTFDWEDIRQVRTHRPLNALFADNTLLSGPISVTPAEIIVGGDTPGRMPRPALESLTPDGSREIEFWSGKLSVGLTLRGGNTDQLDYSSMANLTRRTPHTRLTFDYTGSFSQLGGEESANSHRATTQLDRWLSRRLYVFAPYIEYFRDPFQNLEHRLTGSVGLGYEIISQRALDWSVLAGPAYQYAWFESAQPGEPTDKGSVAMVFGTQLDWDITRQIDFSLSYRGQFTGRDVGETTMHLQATLSVDITKRLDLDISFIWDRISNPQVGSDGIQPKPDDYRLVVGLGLEF